MNKISQIYLKKEKELHIFGKNYTSDEPLGILFMYQIYQKAL